MSKIVREDGGFYYQEDDYGHREPVNVSTRTEIADGLFNATPMVAYYSFKFCMGIWHVMIKTIKWSYGFVKTKIEQRKAERSQQEEN